MDFLSINLAIFCGLVSLFVESIYYHCHCESLEVNCVKEKLPIVLCKYFKRPNNYYTKSRTNVNISSIWTVVLIISCFSTPNLSVKHRFMSFCKIHSLNKRALPSRILLFKHAVTLHRLFNAQNFRVVKEDLIKIARNEQPKLIWGKVVFDMMDCM